MTIDWQTFQSIDLRVGTVLAADVFPEARQPAYRLTIDFGPEIGHLVSSAQITDRYTPASLVGRQAIAVVNLPPKQIGPMHSHCLVTGFPGENGSVVLAVPDRPIANGTRLA